MEKLFLDRQGISGIGSDKTAFTRDSYILMGGKIHIHVNELGRHVPIIILACGSEEELSGRGGRMDCFLCSVIASLFLIL